MSRRMFSKEVSETDWFTSMSAKAQSLYFHICLNSDDEGFCNCVRQCEFMAHASRKNYGELIEKSFIIERQPGVVLVKHWRINNSFHGVKIKPTKFAESRKGLYVKSDGSYTLDPKKGSPIDDSETPSTDDERHQIDTGDGEDAHQNDTDIGEKKVSYLTKPNLTKPNSTEPNHPKESKLVKTGLKQRSLCGIMVDYGFLSEEDLKDPGWDGLMDGWAGKHGLVDTKVKLEYVLDGISHFKCANGEKRLKKTVTEMPENRYSWLREAMERNFAKEEGK